MQKVIIPCTSNSQPRILILSMRDLEFHVSRSFINEFENCISSWEQVDLLSIPHFSKTIPKKIVNNLSRKYFQISGNPRTFNPIHNYFNLTKEYDLFFYICQKPIDLLYLNSISNWRDRCSKAVCFLDEVWMENYAQEQKQLSVLKQFDYIFMNLNSSIKAVAKTTGKPCYYLAPGVDAVEFCPYPSPPQRNIDVCSFGRRSPTVHQSLLELGEKENFLYVYDTMQHLFTGNYQHHRALYQSIVKRSSYFIAYKAKFNLKEEIGVQEEVNVRFFEAASGGAVILGIPPQSETYTQNFDWQDAVIEVPPDTTNVAEAIAELNAQPERLKEIRKNNVVNSLLRHDWVYRWGQILDRVGLSHTPKMVQRRSDLQSLADMAVQKIS
jgi:Glycosyl transferases group 1